jgi:hypothetical protein
MPVWLMPAMAEAMTAKEALNEQAHGQSLPRLRPSGPAGTSVPLPIPGAPQLLTPLCHATDRYSVSRISWYASPAVTRLDPPIDVPLPDPPWWCLLPIACQGLERSPARVDARLPCQTRMKGSRASWDRPGLYGHPGGGHDHGPQALCGPTPPRGSLLKGDSDGQDIMLQSDRPQLP